MQNMSTSPHFDDFELEPVEPEEVDLPPVSSDDEPE